MTALAASSLRSVRTVVSLLVATALCASLLALVGCGDDGPAPAADAGAADLGGEDGSAEDAGESDAGQTDDAGPADDAGTVDAGAPDPDAGVADTDAGASDAGPGDVDAGGPMMCTMRPRTGCCFVDGDCTGPRERCVGSVCDASGEGVCKADPPGADTCWDDKDCRAGTTCMSANICPCGAACFIADMPGVCVPTI